jgi:hypothetical protein
MNTRDLIDISYSPWGVSLMALVADHTGGQWYETIKLVLFNECESDWHTPGECECPTDADYHAAYQQHLTANGYRLITWQEMED